MKEKTITGVLINPDDGTAEKKTIDNNLQGYYEALNCDIIDIVERTLGDNTYDIICDDEGLLKDNYTVSAIDKGMHVMLVGRIFLCHHDDEGELTSLNDDEIIDILKHCRLYKLAHEDRFIRILCPLGY